MNHIVPCTILLHPMHLTTSSYYTAPVVMQCGGVEGPLYIFLDRVLYLRDRWFRNSFVRDDIEIISYELRCVIFLIVQAAAQRVDLSVIWYAITLIWHYCDVLHVFSHYANVKFTPCLHFAWAQRRHPRRKWTSASRMSKSTPMLHHFG